MLNYLDLFSGIGGFALGAYWAGFRCDNHYFSDIEPCAVKLYQQRFHDAIPLGDIAKINGKELPSGEWIITGGFPCQDISFAGKGAGLGGSRSGLWFHYARLISELRPRYAIMENVGALTIRGLDGVLGSLSEIGYDAEWCDIRASEIGAPHIRERIWIVSYANCSIVQRGAAQSEDCERERKREKQLPRFLFPSIEDAVSSSRIWRADNGVSKRMDGRRNKHIGNAIVPQIAQMIFEAIMENDDENRRP